MLALSNTAKSFIDDRITSIENLEMLLFLRKNPDRRWSIPDIAKKVGADSLSVSRGLNHLVVQGLLEQKRVGPFYVYQYPSQPLGKEEPLAEIAAAMEKAAHEVRKYFSTTHKRKLSAFSAAMKLPQKDE